MKTGLSPTEIAYRNVIQQRLKLEYIAKHIFNKSKKNLEDRLKLRKELEAKIKKHDHGRENSVLPNDRKQHRQSYHDAERQLHKVDKEIRMIRETMDMLRTQNLTNGE